MSSHPILSAAQINKILSVLNDSGCTPADFILSLLQTPTVNSSAVKSIYESTQAILESLTRGDSQLVVNWAMTHATRTCTNEIAQLAKQENGFHFIAPKATKKQLKEIDINDMATRMQEHAPVMWLLLDNLLAADKG